MIAVIVPVYNEQEVLPELYVRLTKAAETWGEPWEVIAVDDGSRDDSLAILRKLRTNDARWKIISFSRNFGHQAAVSAGLSHASGDCVVIMDADLQDPPEVISRFIAKWREGFRIVYAVRHNRKEGFCKVCCYKLFYRILKMLANIDIPLDSGDFCLMDRRVVEVINAMPERNRFIRGMRAWAGFRKVGVGYDRAPRAGGRSNYTMAKQLNLAMDGIFSFSTTPLRFIFLFGMGVSVLSMAIGIFTIIQRIFASWFATIGLEPVPGFATIVSGVFFLGGVQLICLGIIGEYVGRVYDESRRRPHWVIEEAHGLTPHE